MKNSIRLARVKAGCLFVAFCLFITTDPLVAQWTQTNGPNTGNVFCVAVSGTNVFAGTYGGGIFRSIDDGASWTPFNTGLLNIFAQTLVLNSSGHIFVGTGGGAVSRSTQVTTSVDDGLTMIPESFGLSQNYPNPFNPSTTITYALPRQSHVALTVYNILGQEVVRLLDEIQEPGRKSVMWNGRDAAGSSVSSGVYFYRLEAAPGESAEGFAQVRRLMVLK